MQIEQCHMQSMISSSISINPCSCDNTCLSSSSSIAFCSLLRGELAPHSFWIECYTWHFMVTTSAHTWKYSVASSSTEKNWEKSPSSPSHHAWSKHAPLEISQPGRNYGMASTAWKSWCWSLWMCLIKSSANESSGMPPVASGDRRYVA